MIICLREGDTEMKHEFTLNGDSQKIALIPSDPSLQRDKIVNRLAFDGNAVITMDLRDDGALVFMLGPKEAIKQCPT